MNERIYIAIDVETTGLVAGVDELIEVAAVKFRGDAILEQYSQLVCSAQALPLKITRLTGITPEDLAVAPRFNDIGPDFVRFVGTHPIVGHSVGFDLGMLRAQGMNFAQPSYDTFELATLLVPEAPVYTLVALAQRLGIPLADAHRALNDATATAHVFTHLLGRIQTLTLEDLTEITSLTARLASPIHDLFDEVLRDRRLRPFEEAPIRSAAWERGTPLAALANEWPPLKPTGDTRPLELEAVAAFFVPEGPLGRLFAGYEPRAPQVVMAQEVAATFNEGGALLVEAGTGTGKSIAYLTPAALFAAQRGERVVVSTNTINLQDQLFFKDIPTLQHILAADHGADADSDPPFVAALLKGRSNYLCLKRYHDLRRNEKLAPEEIRTLLKVQLWLPTTMSGDKAELLLMDRENAAWARINVTPETCSGRSCTHFPTCFFFQARAKAEAAHLIVINHALLIADLANDSKVLPTYEHLIVDEAHNLEDVATDQLSFTLDQAEMFKFLDELYQEGGAQGVSGLLSELPKYFPQEAPDSVKVGQAVATIQPVLTRTRVAVYDCFKRLTAFITAESKDNQYDSRLRLTPNVRNKPEWLTIQTAWSQLSDTLVVIGTSLSKIEGQMAELGKDKFPGQAELMVRVEYLRRFATEVPVQTNAIIFGDEASISWLTLDRQRDTLTLTAAPLSVANILETQLFTQKQTSILASATLTVEANFAFMQSRLGLPEATTVLLDSPFDYETQALVFIPSDFPEPNQRGYQQAVEQALIELCGVTGGRTLALFTANNALKQTYGAIQEPLEEQGIVVLGQGIDGSRRALLERFKTSPRTVLLGTNSFWEGVDVVGDALSVLVIAKLPFSVPTDPIYAARSEEFGKSGFEQFAVPQSILRFKQGFGRLIRSRSDRGIVVVLDSRLLNKKYGQQFLASLPHTRVRTGPLKQLPVLAARFLA